MAEIKVEGERKLRELGVSMIVLFGSAATKAKKAEDIDVAVFLKDNVRKAVLSEFKKQHDITLTLADFLSESLDKLDAVFVWEGTAPLLAFHIARDGELLFGSEADFMRFRLLAIKVYQDSEKFFALRRQYLHQAYV